jgi:hypothetical protein
MVYKYSRAQAKQQQALKQAEESGEMNGEPNFPTSNIERRANHQWSQHWIAQNRPALSDTRGGNAPMKQTGTYLRRVT